MTKEYNAESIKILSNSEATDKFPWKKIEYLAEKYKLGQEPIKRGFEASFILGISPDYYVDKYIKKIPLAANEEFTEVYKELLYKQNVERKLKRLEARLECYKDGDSLSNHSIWSKGYILGQIDLLENLLDDLEEG